jgi:DNA polymerase III alpha subunit
MRMMEEDGDKDRLAAARAEAEKAFKIRFPKFKFGQDNRAIVADEETNSITASLKTIKGFGTKVGDAMYELSHSPYGTNFVDLLVYAEEGGYLSSKFVELIKIKYFSAFGGNKKLLEFLEEFRNGKNRYSKKLKSKDVRLVALREIFATMQDEDFSFSEQIEMDMDVLGYIQSTFEVSGGTAYILNVKTKTNSGFNIRPIIQLYGLRRGMTSTVRVDTRLFNKNPFHAGDIVDFTSFQKKPQGHYDEFHQWVEDPNVMESWALGYDIVQKKG